MENLALCFIRIQVLVQTIWKPPVTIRDTGWQVIPVDGECCQIPGSGLIKIMESSGIEVLVMRCGRNSVEFQKL